MWVSPTGPGGYASPGAGLLRGPSPLLSIFILIGLLATFAMMGFFGVISNMKGAQWDINGYLYRFWVYFYNFGNAIIAWRARAIFTEFFVVMILSIILISSKKIRSSPVIWIFILVISLTTTVFNVFALIPSDRISFFYFSTGVTGPSIIELVLVLGLAVLSVAGLIQASLSRRGK
jgi:hypothetical protein